VRVATPVGNSAKGGAPPVLGAPTGTAPPGAAQERASPISDAAWERHHAWHAECWAVQVMKPEKPTERDVNQGEGNRVAALHYNDQLREFVAAGKVEPAARAAESFVEHRPEEAARAEHKAKRGPHTHITLDEMMAKSRTVVERVRPILNRAVGKLRSRFGRK